MAVYESGEGSIQEVSERFGVCKRSLVRWLKLKRETGDVVPKARGGGNFTHVDFSMLQTVVAEMPDATTYELAAAYNRRVPKARRAHRSSIFRALVRHGYVHKKNGFALRSKTGRTFKRNENSSCDASGA